MIRENTAENKIVYNSGIVELDTPFYPTDANGEYVPLTITVPASSAPLAYSYVNTSDDKKTAWAGFNMAIRQADDVDSLAAGITLSTDGGSTWTGTSSNPIVSATIKENEIKITFTNQLVGKQNRITVSADYVSPLNDYFQSGGGDYVTSNFDGFLQDSLLSMDMDSVAIAAGSTILCRITGNKDDYQISRNATISVKQSGSNTEIASRTQADNRVAYTLLSDSISFYVGTGVAAGTYVFSYTDSALTGEPKTVTANVQIIASNAITYTSYEMDEQNVVLSLTMNNEAANAKGSLDELASAIQLSTDGGSTWTGTTGNPVVAVGFTNTEGSYTEDPIHNMRIEFTHPLSGEQNVVKVPAGSIKTGSTNNVEFTTPIIRIEAEDEDEATTDSDDLTVAVSNSMVNGYENGYKWTLTIWNEYDVEDPDAESIESFESYFDTRDYPQVEISGPTAVTQRNATWTGQYSQGQDVPMMWHKWVLVGNGETVEDTGNIYSNMTPTFTYDGLLSGVAYTITLTCVTQDGVEASDSLDFTVSYSVLDSNGVTRVYQRQDGSLEFQCANMQYITGVPSGDNYTYIDDMPVDGHTSLRTGEDTTISFNSTIDADMDFSAGDTLIARLHSQRDGTLLDFTSDNGSFSCQLIHRGLAEGLVPALDLYPATDLYPESTQWGEFVYIVNGVEIATYPTPFYGLSWYTVCLTYTSMSVVGVQVGWGGV